MQRRNIIVSQTYENILTEDIIYNERKKEITCSNCLLQFLNIKFHYFYDIMPMLVHTFVLQAEINRD